MNRFKKPLLYLVVGIVSWTLTWKILDAIYGWFAKHPVQ